MQQPIEVSSGHSLQNALKASKPGIQLFTSLYMKISNNVDSENINRTSGSQLFMSWTIVISVLQGYGRTRGFCTHGYDGYGYGYGFLYPPAPERLLGQAKRSRTD